MIFFFGKQNYIMTSTKSILTKSPDTKTRDTEDTEKRVSDTDTATPGIRTRRTRYI